MDVREERFNESSPSKPENTDGYRYVGTTYRITEGGETLIFRKFDEVPARADLVEPVAWTDAWLGGPAFRAATAYLAHKAGISAVRLCSPSSGAFTDDVVFVDRAG